MTKHFSRLVISIFVLNIGCNDDSSMVEELEEPEPNHLVLKTVSQTDSGTKVTVNYVYDQNEKIDDYRVEVENSVSQYTIEFDYIYSSDKLSKIEERLVKSSNGTTIISPDRNLYFTYSNDLLSKIEIRFLEEEENEEYTSYFNVNYNEFHEVDNIVYSSSSLYFGEDVISNFHYTNGNVTKVEGFVGDELRIQTEYTYGSASNGLNTIFTGFNYSVFSKDAPTGSKETNYSGTSIGSPNFWQTVYEKNVSEENFDEFDRLELKRTVYKKTSYNYDLEKPSYTESNTLIKYFY
ncbi:MAG: hypothetical protein ABJO02_18395 [Reichenbachiella sp.]|uniref:hypothetical protein n=1 Tax=Reichenbachiella sp. TaxID=2184521 RepID=UPI003297BD14